MQGEARVRLGTRWYRGLVEPVLPLVAPAIERVRAPDDDPWLVPRTGLGGAVVVHVARGFGSRRWKRAGRAAVIAIEAWNQRVFHGMPAPGQRIAWLEQDLDRLNKVWGTILRREPALVSRVLRRVLGERADLADEAVPEAVLFLRAAVAAGVLAGDVPDAVHAVLDRHATWLGLAWEAHQGTLDADGWRGALRGIGQQDRPLPSAPATAACEQAGGALSELPQGRSTRLMMGILGTLEREVADSRTPAAWRPMLAPEPAPGHRRPWLEGSELGAFAAGWRGEIEETLRSQADSSSEVLRRAVSYLTRQGGKRVRALMTLAAAQACGGMPRRALPAAAAVEWLHQASLVLDDMIDEAPLRRGGATLHTATSVPFAAGVAGFVFARIHEALRGMHPQIRDRLVEAAVALIDGEQRELRHTADLGLDRTGYYRVIEAKTARLFSCAAAAGALSVEAPADRVKALARYGQEAGLAFQIVDDVLDYTGDVAVLGKQPGTDLRAGKVTLPVLLLLERLDEAGRGRLIEALSGAGGGPSGTLEWLREEMVSTGTEEACMETARGHLERARAALLGLPEGEGVALLRELAGRLVERRR